MTNPQGSVLRFHSFYLIENKMTESEKEVVISFSITLGCSVT